MYNRTRGRSVSAPAVARRVKRKLKTTGVRTLTKTKSKRPTKLSIQRPRMFGTYKGYFRKTRFTKFNPYYAYGAVINMEHPMLVNNADCVYIGHTFAWDQIMFVISQAIVRKLAMKMGMQIRNIEERIRGNQNITWTGNCLETRIRYRNNPEDTILTQTATFSGDDTWADVAASLRGFFNAGVGTPLFEWYTYTGYAVDNGGLANRTPVVVNFTDMQVYLDCASYMTLQNRTLATSTGTADESSMLDVANNPLEGRLYQGSGSGAVIRFGDQAAQLTTNMIGSPANGRIEFDVNGANVTGQMKQVLRRPPSVSALGYAYKSTKVRLSPGGLKKDVISMKGSWKLSTLMIKLRSYLDGVSNPGATVRPRIALGKFSIFAMEKLCRTAEAGEPNITVGGEINQTVKCRVMEKKIGMSSTNVVVP